jgi:DNA-directed RNA polymerase subunit RPC12/RpoP
MAYHNFIPYVTKAVIVKFNCLDCGNEIEEEISVPWPDLESDDIEAEDTIENDTIQCPNCEKDYNYSIVSYGDLELENTDDEQIGFVDIFYDEPESDDSSDGISILQKWNSQLILKEPSKKFVELVLKNDSSKDVGTIRREWFNEKISLKNSIFKEPPSQFTIYHVESSGGRELLTYYVKDSDAIKFEREMKSIWHIVEDCYGEEWWKEEYKSFDSTCVLFLTKSKVVIAMHYRGE